jgi:DNA-binding NtrC family response regulator
MKRRILVVDDDRFMVRTLCDVLRLQGWEASGAFSGEEAIRAVREGNYPVVLMDIKMPGMDGVAAFKAIKRHRPGIRVVLMTAYTAQELINEAEREGVMRVLPKPVALGPLLELLDASLQAERPVLVVDHDRPFLNSLSDVLQVRGYATRSANTLDAAVEALEGSQPTAVLLHLTLDSIEPRDSVIAIHEMSPAVALILYSGHSRLLDEAKVSLPSDWVYAYLQKPFPVERLTALLDELADV